jgi:hypothetical protein
MYCIAQSPKGILIRMTIARRYFKTLFSFHHVYLITNFLLPPMPQLKNEKKEKKKG